MKTNPKFSQVENNMAHVTGEDVRKKLSLPRVLKRNGKRLANGIMLLQAKTDTYSLHPDDIAVALKDARMLVAALEVAPHSNNYSIRYFAK
jgi:hypothetical protein